jgi:hypothetical protein
MTYLHQWFGMMTAYNFTSGCMLGLASPATYFQSRIRTDPQSGPGQDRSTTPEQIQHMPRAL